MAAGRSLAVAVVAALAVAACGKSPSAYKLGYRGYTPAAEQPPPLGQVSPPSSGTSNGTGEAVPVSARADDSGRASGNSTPPGAASPAADAAPGGAAGGADPAQQLSEQDRQFLYWATQRTLALAALDRLAMERAQSAAVKAFAQNSLARHEQQQKALDGLASAAGVSPPHDLEKEYRDLHDNMAAVHGADFDRLFMRTVIAEERDQIGLYDQQGRSGRSTSVDAFVTRTLPQLHQHYAEARRVDLQLPGTAPLMAPSGTVETHQPSPEPMSR